MDTAQEIINALNVMLMREDLTQRETEALEEATARLAGFGDEVWITAASVNENTRRIDVALNGERHAAPQAMLCDVVAQIEQMNRNIGCPVFVALGRPDDYYAVEFATRDERGDVTVHRRSRKSYPEWLSECEWVR